MRRRTPWDSSWTSLLRSSAEVAGASAIASAMLESLGIAYRRCAGACAGHYRGAAVKLVVASSKPQMKRPSAPSWSLRFSQKLQVSV